MKRSEINHYLESGQDFFAAGNFVLPPYECFHHRSTKRHQQKGDCQNANPQCRDYSAGK